MAEPQAETRDPTLREMRATLARLHAERENPGSKQFVAFLERVTEHFEWLLDSYLFDTDPWADDGGRS